MEFLNVFASVDKDEDLVIHEADLDNYAAEMNYEKKFTRKWLNLFDQNKDGKITFTEFCDTLGLDEKIYHEKLLEARKNVAQRKQQQKQQQMDSDRASRRTSRLPRATASKPEEKEVKENIEPQQTTSRLPRETASKPVEQEMKENIEPQQAKKVKVSPPKQQVEEEVNDEIVKPQVSMKAQAGVKPDVSPEEVRFEFGDDPSSISVEFSDMEAKDLDEVKRVLARSGAELNRRSASNKNAAAEFERLVMNELDKKLGKTWQCQVNPQLSHAEVNYQEGGMAVLVTPPQNKRVMVWRPQATGGCCCC